MDAIQVVKANEIVIANKEQAKLEHNDDVLIKVKAVGICGSDMHIYHGTSPVATYPRVIGHETAGEVVEVGRDVKNIKVGDHVVVEPIIPCGECYSCRNQRFNACSNLKVRGCHVDGGMQEYVVAPAKNVFPIAKHIDWQVAAMIEPYTIAAQITWRAGIKEGDNVFIMGAGPIGLATLEMAKLRGGNCIISDYNEKRLQLAKEMGADYILNPKNVDVLEEVRRITNQEGSNVTIDAVCLAQTFEQAIEITSAGGCVMCLGFSNEPSKIAQLSITLKELDVKGSRHQTFQFAKVVELFNDKKLNAHKLISHSFDYKDIDKAIDMIENNQNETIKIVLNF